MQSRTRVIVAGRVAIMDDLQHVADAFCEQKYFVGVYGTSMFYLGELNGMT